MNLRKDHCIDRTKPPVTIVQPSLVCVFANQAAPVPGLEFCLSSESANLSKVWRARRLRPTGWLKPHSIQTQPSLKPTLGATSPQFKPMTTLNNGYLGSRIDEERSEMRYVV